MQYQEEFAYQLLTFYDRLIAPLQEDLKPYGITAKNFFVMQYIGMNPGVSQQNVADAIHKDKTLVRQIIDKLEKKELVERRPGPDRRSYALYVTEKGQQVIDTYEHVLTDTQTELFSVLDEREKKAIKATMAKLSR